MKKILKSVLCIGVIVLACMMPKVFALEDTAEKMLRPTVSKDQRKEIEALMAPIRQQLDKALEKKDPALYKSYLADQKKLLKITDPKELTKAIKAMDAKYLAFVTKVYKAAKIDEKAFQNKAKSILGISAGKFRFGDFMSIIGTNVTTFSPSDDSGCEEYVCPFEVTKTTSSGSLIDFGSAFIDTDKCGGFLRGFTTLAGGGEKTIRLGKTVSVPANMSRVDITLEEDYSMDGKIYSVIGGGYGESQIAISLKGPGGLDKVSNKITQWAIAPVIWYTYYESTAEHEVLTASFTPQSSGGDYTIQAFAKVYEFTAALVSGTFVSSSIDNIHKMKICFVK
ncbi:MAG: hypothetical protein E3K36_10535 [Candidatus Brocadia sp.]|nr:hypothetical protein [Candidatus Brocadia sp.]